MCLEVNRSVQVLESDCVKEQLVSRPLINQRKDLDMLDALRIVV